MILTKKAIKLINNLDTRLKLASALAFTETWIRECINANKDNGPLTTMKAIQIIREETGLNDSQILEETKQTV
jgi:hypothetical protein